MELAPFILKKRSEVVLTLELPPAELVTEILSYLPAKSLLRFRSVSKSWKSLIEDEDFATLHLKRFPNNLLESHLLVFDNYRCRISAQQDRLRLFHRRTNTFKGITKSNHAGPDLDSAWKIEGSANGLILMQKLKLIMMWESSGDVILWNPSIRRRLNIPLPPYLPPRLDLNYPSTFPLEISIGFDDAIDDYKVVLFVPCRDLEKDLEEITNCSIQIFSLKARSWGPLVPCAAGFRPGMGQKLFFQGCIHWVEGGRGHDEFPTTAPRRLVSFNVNSQVYSFTGLPPIIFDRESSYSSMLYYLAVVGSSLGLLTCCGNSIWILETNSSNQGNWTKKHRIKFRPDYDYWGIFYSPFTTRKLASLYYYNPAPPYFPNIFPMFGSKSNPNSICVMHVDTYVENLFLLK